MISVTMDPYGEVGIKTEEVSDKKRMSKRLREKKMKRIVHYRY